MKPLLLSWLAWLLGPVVFVLCALANDGDPDCFLAFVAVAGHTASVVITVMMLVAQRRFRSLPEFWLMLTYWAPLAGMFVGMMGQQPAEFGRLCFFVVLWWAVLTPIAGGVRLAVALSRPIRGGKLPSNTA